MENTIVKTTTFRDYPGGEVILEEMQDGRKHIRKLHKSIDEEWDALCFLQGAGINIPELYKKDENGLYMQYIDGGMLWDNYQAADTATQHDLIEKFAKLLYNLHDITPKDAPPFDGFIKNEFSEIKTIIEEKQIDGYKDILYKLEGLSVGINENPPCYVHRDYHVWNVLMDNSQKLYLIDMELTQGDFRFDAGWTYMLQSRTSVHDKRHGEIAKAFLAEYYKLRPETSADIEFFMQLANFRWLVNVAPIKKTDKHRFPKMKAIAEQAIEAFLNN
ncbi:MAG: aminoglycoside phosphotransferase family protein [Oscillospiraceae bacterium]|nr:aminoglycoside phosphotransferase family protein [Oscillospiraceae bacterium]